MVLGLGFGVWGLFGVSFCPHPLILYHMLCKSAMADAELAGCRAQKKIGCPFRSLNWRLTTIGVPEIDPPSSRIPL